MEMYEMEALMDNMYLVDKSQWEQTRSLAYIIAQGNSTKKLTPEKIMKFPWDEEESNEHTRLSDKEKQNYLEEWKQTEELFKKRMKLS